MDYFVNFEPEGVRYSKGSYRGNKRNGRWTFYHFNGIPAFICSYSGGKLNGTFSEYYSDGSIRSKGRFLNDKLKKIIEWTEEGERVEEIFCNSNTSVYRYYDDDNLILEGVSHKNKYHVITI